MGEINGPRFKPFLELAMMDTEEEVTVLQEQQYLETTILELLQVNMLVFSINSILARFFWANRDDSRHRIGWHHYFTSSDGCTVASAAGDKTLRFWDVFGSPELAKPAPKANRKPFAHFSRLC